MLKQVKHKESKTTQILKHLLRGRSINGKQALLRYGIYRLSSLIHTWRKKGFTINTEMVRRKNGDTFANYTLKSTPNV